MTVPEPVIAELRTAAAAAADKLATNIVSYDVGERLGITDAFLVCSAPSERQIGAICEEIEHQLKEQHNSAPARREGKDSGTWVLLDYGHMVIHVQHEQERAVYGLDRLYADVPKIDMDLPEGPSTV
ncbi:ribosome silencing factor [Nesterenkonia alkaliphila]|uniref:Ribosomal silencing factor RsfS n=1 Tax=Nesterenkonia alkaliphila TaxID=1463631 RepID=A0A7K1UKK4_9MICC|nr:ribosome silencing factor [Nesterenkonia alkaliphila]MVT27027.1 ribosome silencing factor [Nesterenkonia alkaliphila]GFZ94058.1 ribosomal silencing factor RsfS [Nesterenkonia alkaliphila]